MDRRRQGIAAFLLRFVCVVWLVSGAIAAQAQLSEEDKRQLGAEAEKVVGDLEGLLNYLANPGSSSRDYIARNSYDKNSPDRIFANAQDVQIFDDVDPSGAGTRQPVKSYLFRLQNLFRPSQRNPVLFSNIRLLEVGELAYVYARVYFQSRFYGTYMPQSELPYRAVHRVAEIRFERSQNGWKGFVQTISMASDPEIIAVYGSLKAGSLVNEVEDARLKLSKELDEIKSRTESLMADLSAIDLNRKDSVSLDNTRLLRVSEWLSRMDTLSARAQQGAEIVNRKVVELRVKSLAADSLSKQAADAFTEASKNNQDAAQKLAAIKADSLVTERAFSEAEIAARVSDALATTVLSDPRNAAAGDIAANYVKASSAARIARNSAQAIEDATARMEAANQEIKGLQVQQKNQIGSAQQILIKVEGSMTGIVNSMQQLQNEQRKAALYLSAADSALAQADGILAPVMQPARERLLLARSMIKRVDDHLLYLRGKARESQALAASMQQAADATQQRQLIEESGRVLALAQQISAYSDRNTPGLEQFRTNAMRITQEDSIAAGNIKGIILRKQQALASLGEARRTQSRAAYAAGQADEQVETLKRNVQALAVSRQAALADQFKTGKTLAQAESLRAGSVKMQFNAARLSRDVNAKVNRAYASIVKQTIVQRRHQTHYLGLNYSLYNSTLRRSTGLVPSDQFALGRYSLSVYGRVGGYVRGPDVYRDPLPDDPAEPHLYACTKTYLRQQDQELAFRGRPFTPGDSVGYNAKGARWGAGVYLSVIPHVYFSAGVSLFRGYDWHLYDGDYPAETGLISTSIEGQRYYVINFSRVSLTGLDVGAAFVWPYFQVEAGYDLAFRDVYVRAGLNVPLRKTFMFTKVQQLGRKDYDDLVNEWMDRKP